MYKIERENFEGRQIRVAVDGEKKYYIAKDFMPDLGYGYIANDVRKYCNSSEIKVFRRYDFENPKDVWAGRLIAVNPDGFETLKKHRPLEKVYLPIPIQNESTQNNYPVFDFEGMNVRTLVINSDPWFVGKDVAQILGYRNTKDALAKHVDPEDSKGSQITTPSGVQVMKIINESGLYSLILSSKLPAAKKFKRWVTSEVLPALRKYGAYSTNSKNPIIDQNELTKYRIAMEDMQSCLFMQAQMINDLKHQLTEMDCKLDCIVRDPQPEGRYVYNTDPYLQIIDNGPVSENATNVAKLYGMDAQDLNRTLEELGVQEKNGVAWKLTKDYENKGYVVFGKVFVNPDGSESAQMRWTRKGRYFIHDLLTTNGLA